MTHSHIHGRPKEVIHLRIFTKAGIHAYTLTGRHSCTVPYISLYAEIYTFRCVHFLRSVAILHRGSHFFFCGRGVGNEGCDESVNIFAFTGTLFICSSFELPFFCLLDLFIFFFLYLLHFHSFLSFYCLWQVFFSSLALIYLLLSSSLHCLLPPLYFCPPLLYIFFLFSSTK